MNKLLIIILLLSQFVSYAQCDASEPATLSVSASGFEASAGYTQTYVLVDSVSGIIQDIQSTGTFNSVVWGEYHIYAVNFEGSTPSMLTVDSLWSSLVAFDTNAENCIALLGPQSFTVCKSACYNSTISVSTSSYENGTNYKQIYVLVNKNDSIYASNTLGNFTQTDYLDSGLFRIFAVNTSDAAVEAEIADAGLWSDIETMELSTCTEYISIQFSINSCPMPMNLKDIVLYGQENNDYNTLEWNSNDDNLILEKSENGILFQNLTNVTNQDNYIDYNPSKMNYYRLKAGKYYSNIVYLENKFTNLVELNIFPNPSNDVININFMSKNSSEINLKLSDALGRSVFSTSFMPKEGSNIQTLDVRDFSSGIYHITFESFNQRIIRKIIIKH